MYFSGVAFIPDFEKTGFLVQKFYGKSQKTLFKNNQHDVTCGLSFYFHG